MSLVQQKGSMTQLQWLGRLCLSTVFIAGGWDAASAPGGRAAKLAALGLPQPELLVRANGGLMLLAGMALALGRWPRMAAAILAGVLVPTTLVGHPFWQETTPANRTSQQVHFLKNLGLLGGLLLVIAQDQPA